MDSFNFSVSFVIFFSSNIMIFISHSQIYLSILLWNNILYYYYSDTRNNLALKGKWEKGFLTRMWISHNQKKFKREKKRKILPIAGVFVGDFDRSL